MSQIYLAFGNVKREKLEYYINIISNSEHNDPPLENYIHGVLAVYSLKYELNYTKSVQYLLKSYNYRLDEGKYDGALVNLTNIVGIYAIRLDTTGYKYAKKGMTLMKKHNVNYLVKVFTFSAMAEMSILTKDYSDTKKLLDSASFYINKYNISSMKSQLLLMYALNEKNVANYLGSQRYFDSALKYIDETDIITATRLYLCFGELFYIQQNYARALSMFEKGLQISYEDDNILYRYELLEAISDTYNKMGNLSRSYDYYQVYTRHRDSLLNFSREREFNNFQLLQQRTEHKQQIKDKEIYLLKLNRAFLIVAIILLLTIGVMIIIIINNKRKNRMNAKLVQQHQTYIERFNRYNKNLLLVADKKEHIQAAEEDPEKILYLKIEKLMRVDRLYADGDLTIEKLAKILDSNRTYISKSINKYAGVNFYNFINTYRIEEAIKVLSDENNEIPLKQLYENVGYNSMSTFYRAFQKETGCAPSQYKASLNTLKKDDYLEEL